MPPRIGWADLPDEIQRDIIFRALTTIFHQHATDANDNLPVSRWFCPRTLHSLRQLGNSYINILILAAFRRMSLEGRQDINRTSSRIQNGEIQLQSRLFEMLRLWDLLQHNVRSLPS